MSIVLNQIRKAYSGQVILRDISLEISDGEFFVLLGASGSGKSTLLKVIAGLTEQDSGQVLLNGRDVTSLPPQARRVGFVFQNYGLFRHMTVAQNIAFGLESLRVPKPQRAERVRELLALIGLEGYEQRLPSQLSGGQQQRVAVARALAYKPEVLLLDEPFGALDVKIRGQLRRNLREIQRRLGVTGILVTHDQEEAFELADRIGIIEQGRLLEVGRPDALYRRPQTHFAATFLGEANLLAAHRNGTRVAVGDWHIPAPPETERLSNQAVHLLIRPEEVALANAPQALGATLLGQATLLQLEFIGSQERALLRLSDGRHLTALLAPDVVRDLGLHVGEAVYVGLRAYHLLPLE